MPKKRPKETAKNGGKRAGAGRNKRIQGVIGHGGARPGAGRKPGPAGFQHKQTHRVVSLRDRFQSMPLEHMLCVMNNIDPDTQEPKQYPMTMRNEMAAKAAPFLHPKLSNVNLQARQKYSVDVDKLTDAELIEFERLLLKCQVPAGQQTAEDIAQEVVNGDYDLLTGPGGSSGGGGNGTSH